ncbi:MAG TPA: hypothetical protein VFI58_16215 [Xanthobacteraceae bacterium]|nr:hypothetical protein [Xanthobacteraceae bacterium]
MTEADSADRRAAPARLEPWLKLAALVLVVAALGLPVNDLFRYALLVIATVVVVAGTMSAQGARWLAAIAAVALCIAGQILFPAPRIEEGHNVFIVDRAGGALEQGLPREAFRMMAAEFDATYPPARRCAPQEIGCWRGQGFPAEAFAFSADGMLEHPAYSRRVTGIDFSDPVWLRLGFINELAYNWNSQASDVARAQRDRRSLAFLHQWRLTLPWFVMYRFPAAFAGSALCWRGEVIWEGADETFEPVTHASMQCRTLTREGIGRRIFGVAIAHELTMRLVPTWGVRLRQLVSPALALLASAAVLALIVRVRARRLVLPFALVAATLLVALFNDASFIGGVRPFDSGDDGLVYDGYARIMLRQLAAGDIAGALEGVEPVFYFTPGLRYLRAAEHVVFGESYLGYLSLILLLPFLVFALFRRFLPLAWAVALTAIFAAIPIGVGFGSSLVQYVKWASRGFADPAAYVLFLAAFVLLLGRLGEGLTPSWLGIARRKTRVNALMSRPSTSSLRAAERKDVDARAKRGHDEESSFPRAFAAGLLFALALAVRPNIAPAAGILLAGGGIMALAAREFRRVAGLTLGFAAVLAMALHNWVYGGALVLFTTTAGIPKLLVMPPSAYLAALGELAHLDVVGEHVIRALRQIAGWLAGPSESLAMAPLNAAAIVVLIRVVFWRQAEPWLRLTAIATLVQHGVALFYASAGRYYYLTWLLTLLVVAAWVHGEGLDMARRCFPRCADRVAKHPARLALARGLRRMGEMVEG